jgi:molybdopterin converting factor small subunit
LGISIKIENHNMLRKVRIASLLQEHGNLPPVIDVRGDTIGECLDDLIRQYPEAEPFLFDKTGLLQVFVTVNDLMAWTPNISNRDRVLEPGDEVRIMAVISGG